MGLKQQITNKPMPEHIAIILDGNGRWAKRKNLPRHMGHKQGAMNLQKITLEAHKLGIRVMSVYAFSTENWKRPKEEIDYLMNLPKIFEEEYKDDFTEYDIRVVFSGRRDRISTSNIELLERVENKTKDRNGLILNVCLDYGSQYEITEATKNIARDIKKGKYSIEDISEQHIASKLYTKDLPDVDLLIRTSGEIRLSNFLLWQIAYAELFFTKVPWPAFKPKHLYQAIKHYQKRNRKFGGLKE